MDKLQLGNLPLCNMRGVDWKLSSTRRKGMQIECHCTKTWGGAYQVKTPCCDKLRRNIKTGDVLACPSCGWYWTVTIAPEGTVWTSAGHSR